MVVVVLQTSTGQHLFGLDAVLRPAQIAGDLGVAVQRSQPVGIAGGEAAQPETFGCEPVFGDRHDGVSNQKVELIRVRVAELAGRAGRSHGPRRRAGGEMAVITPPVTAGF